RFQRAAPSAQRPRRARDAPSREQRLLRRDPPVAWRAPEAAGAPSRPQPAERRRACRVGTSHVQTRRVRPLQQQACVPCVQRALRTPGQRQMIAKLAPVKRIFDKLTELQWAWLLVMRLGVGCEFLLSGWGKLHRLDEITAYFEKLHIPAASIQAPFIATLEFVGGLLLMLGLGTRIFGFLLGCTMIVAMLTA